MGQFKSALSEHIRNEHLLPSFAKELPDHLLGKIADDEDFYVFLEFVVGNLGSPRIEYDPVETKDFIQRILKYRRLATTVAYAREQGIRSDLGLLAYLMILASGNE